MVLHVQASKRDPFPRFSWNQEGYIDFYNDVEVDKYLSNSDKKNHKKVKVSYFKIFFWCLQFLPKKRKKTSRPEMS